MRRAALYIRGSCVLIPVDSHVFGQQGKKEYGIDNVKVTNSAWDTNLIATSSVRRLPRTSVQVIGWVLTLAPYSATSVSTGMRLAEGLLQFCLFLHHFNLIIFPQNSPT